MSNKTEENVIELQTTSELKEYLANEPNALDDSLVKHKDYSGLKLENITIHNIELVRVDLSGAYFKNVAFKGGTMEAVNFTGSHFDNVIFSDVELKGTGQEDIRKNLTRFNDSKFLNVTFDNSVINSVLFWDLKRNSTLKFNNSKIAESIAVDTIMAGALLDYFTIENTSIVGVDLSFVEGNGNLIINKSKLTGVKMTNSLYRNITITDSTLLRGALNAKNVDELTIKDSRLSFRISVDAINAVIANNELMEDANGIFTLHSSTIKNLVIEHCKGLAHAFMGSVNIDKAFLNKCNWGELNMFNGAFKQLVVKNGNIDTLNLKLTKATELEFENVSFLNQIDGRENKIEFLRGKNITFADNMKGDKDGQIFIRKLKNSAR